MNDRKIKIAGAGISGLTAAINLAKAGYSVEIYEANETSGKRFNGDLQGIENWSEEQDALDFLKEVGIEINFNCNGYREIAVWGPNGLKKDFLLKKPAFYLVKRGDKEGCLDYGLQQQILSNGNIKINYKTPVKNDSAIDIIATGPVLNDPVANAFASGYVFETDIKDQAILILDDNLAKDGYSYFLVDNYYAVIATCIFNNFKNLNAYREKTLEFFNKNLNFKMRNSKKFSGVGNFFLKKNTNQVAVGEAGGVQDYLWGFGMRYAMLTGYLAAQSIIKGENYYKMYENFVLPRLKTSISNRLIFKSFGKIGYKLFIKYFARSEDPLAFLGKFYNPSIIKFLIYPFGRIFLASHLREPKINK